MKKFDKEKFLQTETGADLEMTVNELESKFIERLECSMGDYERFEKLENEIDKLFTKLGVYKLLIKSFYGIEYVFTRNDEYYGLCTEDESDFLIKNRRDIKL